MSVWTREEEAFKNLSPDRQANVEIVSSAYASVFAQKAYLTMPVTTGRRYYDVLDHYGVKSIEELEQKRPGALREEIIIPNIEEGKALAAKIRQDNEIDTLVVPGVFEARKQRWTQEEYMVLWLRFITDSASAVFLSDGWEYSNGGAIEFARALALQFGYVERSGKYSSIGIYDHQGHSVDIESGFCKLAEAIQDLDKRGYSTTTLRNELALVAGIQHRILDDDLHRSLGGLRLAQRSMEKIWEVTESLGIHADRKLATL